MSDKDVKKMTLDELWQEGNGTVNSLDYDRQIEVYTQIIALDPDDANALYNRGVIYSNLKNYEKAIKDYNQAIKLKPDYAKAFYNRGVIYSDLKNHEKAIEDYNQAIKLKPDYTDAFYNRGVAHNDLKNHEKAIEDYNQAIKLKPDHVKAFNNRGSAHNYLKNYEKAIKDYTQAIKFKPKYANVFNNRGNAYSGLKNYEKAIENYIQAIKFKPDHANAFYNRGIAYRSLGKEKEAIDDFKKAQELDPSIIANEKIKAMEREFEEKIRQTQEENKKVQGFQEILEVLEKSHKEDEDTWFKRSKWAVSATLGLILEALFLVAFKVLESGDTYIVYIFSSIVTFAVIRQYTDAKALRIEASNRLAMAKMFETVHRNHQDYQKEFLPKLVDAIVYSTRKEKNNSDGLLEKTINTLGKLRK